MMVGIVIITDRIPKKEEEDTYATNDNNQSVSILP